MVIPGCFIKVTSNLRGAYNTHNLYNTLGQKNDKFRPDTNLNKVCRQFMKTLPTKFRKTTNGCHIRTVCSVITTVSSCLYLHKYRWIR